MKSLLLLLLLSLFSVKDEHGSQGTEFKFPSILYASADSATAFRIDQMFLARYDINCVEKLSDSVNINSANSSLKPYIFPLACLPWEYESQEGKADNSGLELWVDTTNVVPISTRNFPWRIYISRGDTLYQSDTVSAYIKAAPVYLYNRGSESARILVQDRSLQMTMEAKNKEGKWQPVEFWRGAWCGASYMELDIPGRYFAFTKAIAYDGPVLTSARLCLMTGKDPIYSNTFEIGISSGQFERKYTMGYRR